MLATTEAVSSRHNEAGGCNAGFVRDDAILVVVIITDEEDKESPGSPESWYTDVVAAKHGNPDAVVALSIVGDSGLPGGICEPGWMAPDFGEGAEFAEKIIDFTHRFGYGLVGSSCDEWYETFLEEAVSVIDASCDEFIPPG